jgi:hypothetical protein
MAFPWMNRADKGKWGFPQAHFFSHNPLTDKGLTTFHISVGIGEERTYPERYGHKAGIKKLRNQTASKRIMAEGQDFCDRVSPKNSLAPQDSVLSDKTLS